MTRAALTTIVSLAALAGCSSTQPVYRTHVVATNTGELEGTGDALGNALFAKSVILAKHSDPDGRFARETDTTFASVRSDQD